jgi:hypothetical protein
LRLAGLRYAGQRPGTFLKTFAAPLLDLGPFLLPRAVLGTKSGPRQFAHMHYRGIEYAIVEGIGMHMWKWSAFIGGAVKTGQAHSKQAAMVSAEKAIDRALAIQKIRLVSPPERSD